MYYKMIYQLSPKKNVKYVPVLAFHWFLTDAEKNSPKYIHNRWYASIDIFERQIKWLVEHNYTFLDMDTFSKWINGEVYLNAKPILLTFDDGENSQLNLIVPILKKYKAIGCCFVVGKYFAQKQETIPFDGYEDNITHFNMHEYESFARATASLELESHTYNLHYRREAIPAMCIVDDAQLEYDCTLMNKLAFKYIALPYGGYGKTTINIIKKYYKIAFAIDRVGNPYASLKSNKYMINRIIIDGNSDEKFLEKYLF